MGRFGLVTGRRYPRDWVMPEDERQLLLKANRARDAGERDRWLAEWSERYALPEPPQYDVLTGEDRARFIAEVVALPAKEFHEMMADEGTRLDRMVAAGDSKIEHEIWDSYYERKRGAGVSGQSDGGGGDSTFPWEA